MNRILANVIHALTRLFDREMHTAFKAPRFASLPLPDDAAATLDDLKARYSIDIVVPGEPFCIWLENGQYSTGIEGEPATSEQASWYVPLFAEEFGLYPPRLVRQTLVRVVLCGELFRSRKRNPRMGKLAGLVVGPKPLYFSHRPRGGIPNGGNGDLYLSVTSGRDDKAHVRRTIHHEFYHCVQLRQFGRLGDRGWAALNRPDFVYGPGGLRVNEGTDRTFWVMPAEAWGNGFLNQYSMSAPEEDQAEIFAHLITEPARMESRLASDDILQSKVERLKASLETLCPDVNVDFWRDVAELRPPFEL
jgi:hypothetical protein